MIKEQIINTAFDLFSQYGIKSVSMDDVAKAAGISKRTLYESFEDKETLLIEGIDHNTESLGQYLTGLEKEPFNALEVILLFYEEMMKNPRWFNEKFYEDLKKYPKAQQKIEMNKARMGKRCMDLFTRGVKEGVFQEGINFEIMALLVKEQLEADLRFKSKELSGVVMTNIAHQEFLNSLKEELQQQKLSGQYTRKNLDKLLSMINQNMVSDEENWNMFQSNFDRIHENFFRNLKEKFPDLTSGDLRLCALLRLNLPTKEIAKLMNISVRGVDAARYRLRKKLGLPPESSLTDFMIAFK